MSVAHFTKTGTKSTKKASLPKEVFGIEVKDHGLIKQVYLAAQSDQRVGSSSTKTRGQIRGGGRKPWRQKGTGRARAGSIRSPIWRGGGIVFGPSAHKNHHSKINKAAKRRALAQALSLQAADDALVVVETMPGIEKTKEMAEFIKKIVGDKRRVLIVAATVSKQLIRGAGNLPDVQLISAAYLSVPRVLDADVIVIEAEAIKKLEARIGGKE